MQNNYLKTQLNTYKSGSKKKIYIVAFFLVLIGGGAYFYSTSSKKNTAQDVTFNTKNVKKGDLQVSVLATGNLEPTNSVDIGIEVSGTIEEIYVDFNDNVKEGQILAKLDTTKLQTMVDSSKASLNNAKASLNESAVNVKNKKATLDRIVKIFEQSDGKYPSQNDVDDAQFSYEAAIASHEATKARVLQAEFNLKTDEDNLEKAIVKSSINGIVLNRAIEVGQTVAASMNTPVLFTLAKDLKNMDLVVSIDEADVADIKEGLPADFTVDAYPNKIFKGEIKQVRLNPISVSGVVTYETVVSVKNEDLLLRPGMTASATIFTKETKDKLLIPNAALRYTPKNLKRPSGGKGGLQGAMGGPKRPANQTRELGKQRDPSMRPIWVLEDGKPKKVMVKILVSDNQNTAVESEMISENSKVIISQSSK